MLTPTFSDLGGFLMTFKTMAERRITTTPRVYLWVFFLVLLVKYMGNMDEILIKLGGNRVKFGLNGVKYG
jgi:flagellar biosynthesis protein FliR